MEQRLKSFSDELEIKVKERTADLLETNSQLQQFAHATSHDLQEPLRKIMTFCSRLQEKYTDELSDEAKVILGKIKNSSGRMITLIKDLLDYSQLINHEKLVEPTNLNEILKNVLTDFELLIEQKKATIQTDALLVIDAIPMQMDQLFYSLISNGLKFVKEGVPPVIQITSHMLPLNEIKKYPGLNISVQYCELIFKDNGIGLDQKYGLQIFAIFQRLHNRDLYDGTGIGLALCKKIVENHHGEIFVKAKENEGASFHVILPISKS